MYFLCLTNIHYLFNCALSIFFFKNLNCLEFELSDLHIYFLNFFKFILIFWIYSFKYFFKSLNCQNLSCLNLNCHVTVPACYIRIKINCNLYIYIYLFQVSFRKLNMTIYSVYVINKAGGLIYQYDHHKPLYENEKTFRYTIFLFCFI